MPMTNIAAESVFSSSSNTRLAFRGGLVAMIAESDCLHDCRFGGSSHVVERTSILALRAHPYSQENKVHQRAEAIRLTLFLSA